MCKTALIILPNGGVSAVNDEHGGRSPALTNSGWLSLAYAFWLEKFAAFCKWGLTTSEATSILMYTISAGVVCADHVIQETSMLPIA